MYSGYHSGCQGNLHGLPVSFPAEDAIEEKAEQVEQDTLDEDGNEAHESSRETEQ